LVGFFRTALVFIRLCRAGNMGISRLRELSYVVQ
jgi:hypothetical protein